MQEKRHIIGPGIVFLCTGLIATSAALAQSRDVPANDLCENAFAVTGPYPVTVCGTNVDATIDCPGFLDWDAVWYEVELPYAFNDLVTDYCPGPIDMSADTVGIVYYNDCTDCEAAVVGAYQWNDCGNGRWHPKIWWLQLPGPATVRIPVYIAPAHEFCIEFNVTESFPCDLDCPPEAVPESESCGELTNDGCNLPVPQFEPLTCGETICGTTFAYAGMRDTDWFEITVEEPTTMTFTVEAEFIVGMFTGLFEQRTPGVAACDQITGLLIPYAIAADCESVSLVYNALPGTYWWLVTPNDYQSVPCHGFNQYIATMTCEPWELRGACCDDDTSLCADSVLFQDCLEPLRFTAETLCADISPPCGGCPESMIEIEIRTDRYPTETTWTITDHDTGEVLYSGGPYSDDFATYIEYYCIGADDCVDFTIYDLCGDGIWPPYGYAVRLDGVTIYDTIGIGWAGLERHNDNIGHGCELGRCCYEPWPNCAETTLFDCVRLYDGIWNEGLNCTDDPCPDPNACDFEVVAPYTSPQRTTCGGLNRCQSPDHYFDTPEHVYCVTIPHDGIWSFNTCLDTTNATWLAVGTEMCGQDIGWAAYTCWGFSAEVVAYLSAGTYFVDVEGYQQCGTYVLDIHEVIPCDVNCPEEAVAESEPCGDTINDGCWMYPYAFERIVPNVPVCGTIWAADGSYDTDWFEFVAPADDIMTFSVRSNFTALMGLAQQYVPGQPGCHNITGVIEPFAEVSDCEELSVSFPVVAGGTYYLYIGHRSSHNSPCGTTNDYVALLRGSSPVCGDLNCDGATNGFDIDPFVLALVDPAGYAAAHPDCDYMRADLDGDGAVNVFDIDPFVLCLTTGG